MKTAELRQMTLGQLHQALKKIRRDYSIARFKVLSGQETNVAQLKTMKASVARGRTLLREKQAEVSAS
jgi:ribosomal protein L29